MKIIGEPKAIERATRGAPSLEPEVDPTSKPRVIELEVSEVLSRS